MEERMNGSILKQKTLLLGVVFILFSFKGLSVWAQTIIPEDPAKGARLFVSKGCIKCHAFKGEGGKTGPDFGRVDLGNTLLDLASKLLNHIPPMVQGMERMKMTKPNLTGEEITDISAYLYFLKFFDDPGNGTRGQYLFNEKGCSKCHPLSGRGREGEPGLDQFPQNISPVYLTEMIWNHGPVMIAQMVKLGMKWPTFEGTEMMDLLEYIKANAKGPKEAAFITPGNPGRGKRSLSKRAVSSVTPFGVRAGREERTSARGLSSSIRASHRSLPSCGTRDQPCWQRWLKPRQGFQNLRLRRWQTFLLTFTFSISSTNPEIQSTERRPTLKWDA